MLDLSSASTPGRGTGPLAVVYATDEDLAVRAPGDFAVLTPAWQRLAAATDGAIAAGSWLLASAATDWVGQGIGPGHVVRLTGPRPQFAGDGTLLAVDSVSSAGAVLRRLGQPPGVGLPPAAATGITFSLDTLGPQIEDASYAANHLFGIDPVLPYRTAGHMMDPRVLRQWVVLSVLQRQFASFARSDRGDFALKLKQVECDLAALQGRVAVKWGPLGDSEVPHSAFGARVRR